MKKMSVFGVAALAAALTMTGCSDDGDTVVNNNIVQVATFDNFPGGAVQANNLADDMRAFSENNVNVTAVICRRNGANGTAIVLFTTQNAGGTLFQLWASYYNGTTLTRPVELRATDVDYSVGINNLFETSVVFLNTSNNTNANVRARNGDAIIAVRRTDFASNPGVDDQNVSLYAHYFDVSNVGSAAQRFGFDSGNGLGQRVDGSQGSTTQDITGENVLRSGLISDGNMGRAFHTGDPAIVPPNQSGLETSFVIIGWIQSDLAANNVGTPDNDTRFLSRTVNLTSSSTGIVLLATVEMPLPANALTATNGQTTVVAGGWVTVGIFVIIQYDGRLTAGGAVEDRSMGVVRVVDGTATMPYETNPTCATPGANGMGTPTTDGVNQERQMDTFHPNGFYGPNETNNGRCTLFFTAGSNAAGDRVDCFVLEVSADPTVAVNLATDRVQISNNVGVDGMDFADFTTNAAAFPGITGANKRIERLSRDKSHFLVVFREGAPIGAPNGLPNNQLCQLLTMTVGTGSGALATRVSTTLQVSPGTTNVSGYQIGDEYDGERVQTTKALGSQTDCPQQSNPNQYAIAFEQSETGTGDDQVFVAIVQNNGGTAAPTLVGNAVEIPGGRVDGDFEDGEMQGVYAGTANRRLAKGLFLTDNGLNAAGNQQAIVIFIRDNDQTGTDNHLYATEVNAGVLGETIRIDSGDDNRDVSAFQAKTVGGQGFTGSNGSFAGNRIHIVFTEQRINSTSSLALRTRYLDKTLRASNPTITLANEFFPTTGNPPTAVDNDVDFTSMISSIRSSGETFAVYFTQNGNLLYNEFTNNAGIQENGVSAPQLVNNDDSGNVTFMLNCSPVDGNCDDLLGTVTFFNRTDDDGDIRLFARRRN